MIYIPEKIKNIVGEQEYFENGIGMSDSKVLVYPEYVLKIQKQSIETDNEKDIAEWLNPRIPVPKMLEYYIEEGNAYTLMTKINGTMLCDEEYLNNSTLLVKLVAKALKLLWSIDVSSCPFKVSRLEDRLIEAKRNIENGFVNMDNVEPETFEKGGFTGPKELLEWLENNKPKEDTVLSHGDLCLPNIFGKGNEIIGFIDIGKMGPADRWQDIAIAIRSLKHNFEGKYNQGKKYFDFEPEMLLNELGIKLDKEKYRYYLLLDELF